MYPGERAIWLSLTACLAACLALALSIPQPEKIGVDHLPSGVVQLRATGLSDAHARVVFDAPEGSDLLLSPDMESGSFRVVVRDSSGIPIGLPEMEARDGRGSRALPDLHRHRVDAGEVAIDAYCDGGEGTVGVAIVPRGAGFPEAGRE